MALVGYASSDEEEEVPSQVTGQLDVKEEALPQKASENPQDVPENLHNQGHEKTSEPTVDPGPAAPALIGPSLGPSLPASGDLELPSGDDAILDDADAHPDRPPQSPYSANRSVIHDLTLPSVPDFDIPPSPPGSPPPAIDKKFSQFLDLKKKGVHFNQKLEHSAALKNPNLMDKLMRFVEVEGAAQYETTLPKNLWNPDAFPEWAFRENLRSTREKIVKEREAQSASGARKNVDFVPASKSTPRKSG